MHHRFFPLGRLRFFAALLRLQIFYALSVTAGVAVTLLADKPMVWRAVFPVIIAVCTCLWWGLVYRRCADIAQRAWFAFALYVLNIAGAIVLMGQPNGVREIGALLVLASFWIFWAPGRSRGMADGVSPTDPT